MHSHTFLLFSCCSLASLAAQSPSPSSFAERQAPRDERILLEYASFDPLVAAPQVPPALRAGADVRLWIVQFDQVPTDVDRAALRNAGAVLHGYLPQDALLVRFVGGPGQLSELPNVRWVGAYEPAYRLEPLLLRELASGEPMPLRSYNLVMADKRADKERLGQRARDLGGRVVDPHHGGLLFTVELDRDGLLRAARLDEVLWIDRTTPVGFDLSNARVQGGANHVETQADYAGNGIRGHIYEAVEGTHMDFTPALTQVVSFGAGSLLHGTPVAGTVFSDGVSNPQARGIAPRALGYYTDRFSVPFGFSRNAVLDIVLNNFECQFTTVTWGGSLTTAYTSLSAEADDVVFDHRLPWLQSQGNGGTRDSRPEAWAKNVLSVGGIEHQGNTGPADDSWAATTASIGPAADNRIKPDLVSYFSGVRTSDITGPAGYSSGNSTGTFGGTSAATGIVAGHVALLAQMFTDGIFNNQPRVLGGDRFDNRPHAATTKALLIATSELYTPQLADNRREHVGWGFPSLRNLYDRRHQITVVPEDDLLVQGASRLRLFEVTPGQTVLKICMSYADPAANPAAGPDRVNNLDLRVTAPDGTVYNGNFGLRGLGQGNWSVPATIANATDTVECVFVQNPQVGQWQVRVTAQSVQVDGEPSTLLNDSSYALVVNGALPVTGSGCARYVPNDQPEASSGSFLPFGGQASTQLETTFAGGNFGSVGGGVFFDADSFEPLTIKAFELNVQQAGAGTLSCDVYRTVSVGSGIGLEGTPSAWEPLTSAHSVGSVGPGRVRFVLDRPFQLIGKRGLAIVANNFSHRYTNGTSVVGGTPLELTLGRAANTPFTSIGGNRIANVAVDYVRATTAGTNVRYQTILRRDQLGGAGPIRDLAFAFNASGRHYCSSLLVRMSHRSPGYQLTSDFDANLFQEVTVMLQQDHTFRFQQGWSTIGLPVSFQYDGVSDVVVEIITRQNVLETDVPGAQPFCFEAADAPRAFSTMFTVLTPSQALAVDDRGLRIRVVRSCAVANDHGTRCSPMIATHEELPELGSLFRFEANQAPQLAPVVLALAVDLTGWSPVPLDGLGWLNCRAYVPPTVLVSELTDFSGRATHAIGIPNDPTLTGTRLTGQWLSLDPSEPGGVGVSGSTQMRVGVPE